eukprot:1947408-Rhodomonas_salina.1
MTWTSAVPLAVGKVVNSSKVYAAVWDLTVTAPGARAWPLKITCTNEDTARYSMPTETVTPPVSSACGGSRATSLGSTA